MPSPDADRPGLALAEHQAFLHRLAVGLVRDEHLADDLVQDVWLRALARPDGGRGVGRGWFALALRHLSFSRHLSEQRRAARERSIAGAETVDPGDVDERLETQTLVLAAVRRLPEALRTVTYLRYFDELGPAEIASRTGTCLATVKSRLARARALLRQDLRRSGDEGLLVLVPLLTFSAKRTAPGAGAATVLGTLTMTTSGKAAVAAALILGAALAWNAIDGQRYEHPAPQRGAVTASASVDPAAPPTVFDATGSVAASNVRQEVRGPEAEDPPAPEKIERVLTGRVLDPHGSPLSDVAVALVTSIANAPAASTCRAVSRADGSFRLVCPPTAGALVVDSDQLVTLFFARISSTTTREAIVIAARRADVFGRVLDELGAPLAGAEVAAMLPDGFQRRIPYVMDNCFPAPTRTRTDGEGRFEIDNGSHVEGAFLQTSLEGYVTRRDSLATLGSDARIVLRRPGRTADALFGFVLDERGVPVEGARVSFGAEVTRTDSSGMFQLVRTSTDDAYLRWSKASGAESQTLRAVAPDYLPATLEVALSRETGKPEWPDGVVLQFSGSPLEITGRVVDPSGVPLPDIRLFLEEATLFTLTKGARSIENLLGGDPEERFTMFLTDSNGEFKIGGLQDRAYPLVALDWDTAAQTRTPPIPAGGPPVEVVVNRDNVWREVAGRVLSPFGQPLRNVEVNVFTDATRFNSEGRFVRTSNLLVSGATTDADGRFDLADIPKEHVYLLLMGDDVVVTPFGLDEPLGDRSRDSLTGLTFVVSRRAHLQVSLERAGEADAIELLDAAGEPLELRIYRGKPGPPQRRMPFYGTKTDVLAVDEAAQTLLYLREGEVVRRRSVSLEFGLLNEL